MVNDDDRERMMGLHYHPPDFAHAVTVGLSSRARPAMEDKAVDKKPTTVEKWLDRGWPTVVSCKMTQPKEQDDSLWVQVATHGQTHKFENVESTWEPEYTCVSLLLCICNQ
jgi:hypothetical protein